MNVTRDTKWHTTVAQAAPASIGAKFAGGAVTFVDYTKAIAAKATGTITISDYTLLPLSVVTVGSEIYTGAVDWLSTVSNTSAALSLKNAINSLSTSCTATVSSNVITVTAISTGTAGNALAISCNVGSGISFSAATLLGGLPHLVIAAGSNNYTQGTNWNAVTSNTISAANLAAALGTNTVGFSNGAITYVVALTPGTAGNSLNLTTNSTGAATVSGATLAGGAD